MCVCSDIIAIERAHLDVKVKRRGCPTIDISFSLTMTK